MTKHYGTKWKIDDQSLVDPQHTVIEGTSHKIIPDNANINI